MLAALGIVLCLQQAWVEGFFADGYLYAVYGKNAAFKGKWLVPHLNEALYPEFDHHTPFLFIIEGLFFKLFGASFVSARIFASIFYLGTGLFLFRFLKQSTKIVPYFPIFLFLTIPPLFKKVRFPNLDIALMLTFFLAFVCYQVQLKSNEKKYYYLAGLMFGFSMLIKGPVAVLIPIAVVIDLLIQKRLDYLKSPHAWFGLILGFMIFSFWPLSLFLGGKFYIFEQWFNFTFLHTIRDARGTGEPFYTYFLFLLRNAPLWFLLGLIGLKSMKKSPVLGSASVFFLTILIFFSIPKFKYSNYLIPMYPFMAIVGGNFLEEVLGENAKRKIQKFLSFLIPVSALCLLIFPLTTKIRRDPEIFVIKKALKERELFPKKWTIVANGYPFYALAALNEWIDGSLTYQKANPEVNNCSDCVFLVKNETLLKFKNLNPSFKAFAVLKNYGTTLMVPKDYLSKVLKL